MPKESITANKELIVTEIIILINGYITYSDCFRVFSEKYGFTDRTFDKYWKLANQRVKQVQHNTQITIIEDSSKAIKNRSNELIASREELLRVLTKIVRDEVLQQEKPASVVQAIGKICEIEGYNKAVELAGAIDIPVFSWVDNGTE